MFGRTLKHAAISGAIVLTSAVGADAAELTCRILQYKLGRLYLDAGREANVVSGTPFTVFCGGDSVFSGTITRSLMGICYTDTVGSVFDSLAVEACYARVHPPGVDCVSPIVLLTEGIESAMLVPEGASGPSVSGPRARGDNSASLVSVHGNEIAISQAAAYFDLVAGLRAGNIDGFFSFRNYASQMDDYRVVDVRAPFFAVLIPNVGREVNRHGLVTTSLYYRFGGDRIAIVFDGHEADPANCLDVPNSVCPRAYPYDPPRGRLLLDDHPRRPRLLRIGVEDKSLEKLAFYFADVLSRDRITVEIVREIRDADLAVCYVPLDEGNPCGALGRVRDFLEPASVLSPSVQEVLTRIDNFLALAGPAGHQDQYDHYCRLAAKSLSEDLGVFPLFRPHLFFHASERLTDCRFRADGYLELRALTKLNQPSPESTP